MESIGSLENRTWGHGRRIVDIVVLQIRLRVVALGEQVRPEQVARHRGASMAAGGGTCTAIASTGSDVPLRCAHQGGAVVCFVLIGIAVRRFGGMRQPRATILAGRVGCAETLRRGEEWLAGAGLVYLRDGHARAARSYRGLVAVVEQGFALETRVAEVAVHAVEAGAGAGMAVAADIGQRGALIVHVARADV